MLVEQHIQHLETTAHTGTEAGEAVPGRALGGWAVQERIEGQSEPVGGVVAWVVVIGGEAGGGVELLVGIVVVVVVAVMNIIDGAIVRVVVSIRKVRRGHDGDAIVVQIDRIPRNARERVLRGIVGEEVAEVVGLLRGTSGVAEGEVSTAMVRGLAFGRELQGRGGALGVGRVLDAQADEAGADAGGEVFDEVGDAQAEVHVVDDAGAEGGDGVVDEAEGDGYFVFFGAECESLEGALMGREGMVGGIGC